MIAHYGCSEDVSTVIDFCPPCNVSIAGCLSFEVNNLFSGPYVPWDQRVIACSLFLTPLFPHSEKS